MEKMRLRRSRHEPVQDRGHRTRREVLLALQPASLMSPRMRRFISDMREKDVQWMVDGLTKLSEQGWRIRGNPEVFSVAMLHTAEAAAQDWITRRQHLKLEEVAETLCEIWFRTVLSSRPGQRPLAALAVEARAGNLGKR